MTTMADIGEKKFLQGIIPSLFSDPRLIGGIGHDAAVISMESESFDLVLKIDRAAKPISTAHNLSKYDVWGKIAVTTNFSDILAVGGVPTAFAISLSLPRNWFVEDARDIIEGAASTCASNGAVFVGGDTKEAESAQVIGSALGIIEKDSMWKRHSARLGDKIVVLGEIGDFLSACIHLDYRPGEALTPELLSALTSPKARFKEAKLLRDMKCVTSATDLSDGLFDGLKNVLPESLGMRIDYQQIPFSSASSHITNFMNMDLFNMTASVGDWNIIATVRPETEKKLIEKAKTDGVQIFTIGTVTDSGEIIIERDNGYYRFEGMRNEHFKSTLEKLDGYVESAVKGGFLVKV